MNGRRVLLLVAVLVFQSFASVTEAKIHRKVDDLTQEIEYSCSWKSPGSVVELSLEKGEMKHGSGDWLWLIRVTLKKGQYLSLEPVRFVFNGKANFDFDTFYTNRGHWRPYTIGEQSSKFVEPALKHLASAKSMSVIITREDGKKIRTEIPGKTLDEWKDLYRKK